jgi:hypothetical protein
MFSFKEFFNDPAFGHNGKTLAEMTPSEVNALPSIPGIEPPPYESDCESLPTSRLGRPSLPEIARRAVASEVFLKRPVRVFESEKDL